MADFVTFGQSQACRNSGINRLIYLAKKYVYKNNVHKYFFKLTGMESFSHLVTLNKKKSWKLTNNNISVIKSHWDTLTLHWPSPYTSCTSFPIELLFAGGQWANV